MSHEIEASVWGEALVLGKLQHYWGPVDAHTDVLDVISIRP
jgi:hypothetical protein